MLSLFRLPMLNQPFLSTWYEMNRVACGERFSIGQKHSFSFESIVKASGQEPSREQPACRTSCIKLARLRCLVVNLVFFLRLNVTSRKSTYIFFGHVYSCKAIYFYRVKYFRVIYIATFLNAFDRPSAISRSAARFSANLFLDDGDARSSHQFATAMRSDDMTWFAQFEKRLNA